eukprot:2274674-Pleurochrysis_carterae.AAC.2
MRPGRSTFSLRHVQAARTHHAHAQHQMGEAAPGAERVALGCAQAMLRGRGGCYKHTFYGIAS